MDMWDYSDKELSEHGLAVRANFAEHDMHLGRLVCGSKSGYISLHPTHEVYFNANVFTEKPEKVWYGDLDLTVDMPKLQSIANKQNTTLYVLYEMDGRFENETLPIETVIERARATIKPE